MNDGASLASALRLARLEGAVLGGTALKGMAFGEATLESGLLESTLVVMAGEFGRTPKITHIAPEIYKYPGRDHWAPVQSVLFAGGGVRGGQLIGKSDKTASFPTTHPYSPDDVGATVYHTLGVDHTAEVRDRTNRPVQLNRGEVMSALFTG